MGEEMLCGRICENKGFSHVTGTSRPVPESSSVNDECLIVPDSGFVVSRRMNFAFVCLTVLGVGVCGQDPSATSFSCHGRPPGYYADLETGCKAYHVCDGNSHFTYLCPKRTLFQQRSRICDHSYLVRCEDSPSFYEDEDLLLLLEKTGTSRKETLENETTESTQSSAEETTEVPTTFHDASTLTTTTIMEETTIGETSTVNSLGKYLRLRLKDFRSLFFISELENSIAGNPEQEFVLPVEESDDLMRFRNRRANTTSTCSSHCDPKFFVPGSCHPCITIK